MCGIAGVRRFGQDPITGEEIVLLLCAIEHRGNHATGLAIMNDDGIHVLKAPEPAWVFTKSKDFKKFLEDFLLPDTKTVLLHTRFATIGDPYQNDNNHPMTDGTVAVIHNGSISNHSTLFGANKEYKRTCDTDSDIIRAILAEHGFNEKGIRELNKMFGSAAIACVSEKEPDKLLLARSGNPIIYGFAENGEKLYWASEAQAITKACRPWKEIRGVWVQPARAEITLGSMPDNTAWIFGDDHIELHHKFDICRVFRPADYSHMRENYHSKTKNWKKGQKKGVANGVKPSLKDAVIACPKCGINMLNTRGVPWADLTCCKCSSPLG